MGYDRKQRMADALLCWAVSVSLIPVLCSGFVLTDPYSQSLAVVLVCTLLLQALFALLAGRRAAIWLGIGAGAALAVVCFVYMRVNAPLMDDAANSACIFVMIQLLTPLLVFLLSRSRAGTAVLFLLGDLICAGSHFLQFPAPDWCLFVFLPVTAALFLYRVCTVAAAGAEVGRKDTFRYLRQALILCAAALAVAVGLFVGVIAPLDPPTRELKLISELRSMDLLQVLGVSGTEVILDPALTADTPPDEEELEDEDEPDAQDEQGSAQTEDEQEPDELRAAISSALEQAADAIRYDETVRSRLWLLLLLPAAVAAAYVLRLCRKRRWRRRVRAMSGESAVVNYYQFFLSRLGRAGLKKQPAQTLREFAGQIAAQTEPFDACGVSFRELTGIYEKVLYGGLSVSGEELSKFERFYDAFHRALRREEGTLKYYLKAFCY